MLKWINKKRNQKGFTLVELVVVIAILGILAAIAVPRFAKSQESARLRADQATARTIIGALNTAISNEDASLKKGADETYTLTWKTGITGAAKADFYDENIGKLIGEGYLEPVNAPQSVTGTFTIEVNKDDGALSVTNGDKVIFYPIP